MDMLAVKSTRLSVRDDRKLIDESANQDRRELYPTALRVKAGQTPLALLS